jgi:hypothetical protein
MVNELRNNKLRNMGYKQNTYLYTSYVLKVFFFFFENDSADCEIKIVPRDLGRILNWLLLEFSI